MKANELMIGDLVDFYHPYEPEKKIVTRHLVTETFECGLVGISNHPNPVHADHIEPVKITLEILEKNGFKKFNFRDIERQHEWTWWEDTLTNVSLWCRELDDKVDDGWMVRIESPISSLCVKVVFLHELQHALRLCGIDKTIEL